MQELFQSGELATDDPDTQRARFNAAFDRLEFVLGAGVVAVDKTVRPHIYTLVGPAVTEWCVANQPEGVEVGVSLPQEPAADNGKKVDEAPVIDKKQFKKLDVLPGLAQIAFSYIMPREARPGEEDSDAFETMVADARNNTGRADLIRASLSQATKRCVSDANLRRYGRMPGASERYAQVCRIRDRLV